MFGENIFLKKVEFVVNFNLCIVIKFVEKKTVFWQFFPKNCQEHFSRSRKTIKKKLMDLNETKSEKGKTTVGSFASNPTAYILF